MSYKIMKYKVGDKIKLIKCEVKRFSIDLEDYIGETFEITDVDVFDDICPISVSMLNKEGRIQEVWLRETEIELIEYTTDNGLTNKEEEIMKHIIDAWNLFTELESTHPDEDRNFRDAIHQLQSVLGLRILRRDYPNYWLSENKED